MTWTMQESEANISLEEWLTLNPGQCFGRGVLSCCFLTTAHEDQYLASVQSRADRDVKALLRRFLMPSGCLDQNDRRRLPDAIERCKGDIDGVFETDLRLVRFYATNEQSPPPWEGITWVLDLLPHYPRKALQALSAYNSVHCQFLPDGRLEGLWDAMSIIRAKYIGTPESYREKTAFLDDLTPRQLEQLVARLYEEMKYKVTLTPERGDGGRDIIAVGHKTGQRERILVECKRYAKRVGVVFVRSLLGVVEYERANKGILVATNGFSTGAKELAETSGRIELIDGSQLYCLLNEHLGLRWELRIERILSGI